MFCFFLLLKLDFFVFAKLPRLPTFPPPLTDKEDYKEYMQLRYECEGIASVLLRFSVFFCVADKRRRIPLDGAVAFVNVSKTNEGGGFLKIKVGSEKLKACVFFFFIFFLQKE